MKKELLKKRRELIEKLNNTPYDELDTQRELYSELRKLDNEIWSPREVPLILKPDEYDDGA